MYKRADGTDLEALEIMANAACKRYVGIKEGAMLYSLGLHLFSDLAKDAGAKRRIGRRILVNVEVLDKYIEDMFAE